MPVIYGGNSIRPGPQVGVSYSRPATGDGRKLGGTVTARLSGTIVAEKTGDTHTAIAIENRLSTLLAKKAAFEAIFAEDGKMFEIQGWDGSAPFKFNAIVESIDFSEGPWTDKMDYTVTLKGEDPNGPADNTHCDSVSESWTFEEGDLPRTQKATHSLSAKGRTVYDAAGNIPKQSWEYAKACGNSRLGVGWETTTDQKWSPKSGKDLAAASLLPVFTDEWDRKITETIDEMEGTYSVSETWTLSENPWAENYTVSVRRVDEGGVSTTASISGTITGLRKSIGVNFDKYQAAIDRWTTVKDMLVGRCQEAAGKVQGGTLNAHPTSLSTDHNKFDGTLSYQFEYNDRKVVNDTVETWTTSKSVSLDDYKTTVRIEGTITGAVYLDDGPSTTIKFTRADLQWEIVKAMIFARATLKSGVGGLKPFPVQAQVSKDEQAGTVQYSYEFDDRTPDDVRHEFTVSKKNDRSEGRDNISIEGTITGMRKANANSPFGTGDKDERFNLAKDYYNGISGNLLGLASQHVSMDCINPVATVKSVSYNPPGGSVSYTAEFSSQITPLTPGALSEVVTVTEDDAVPVIAIIPILGRAAGPIIQDMGTVKEKRKSIGVEIVMTPPKFGCTTTVEKPTFDIGKYIPKGKRVFKEQDQTQWVESQGRYTRTVSWIFV